MAKGRNKRPISPCASMCGPAVPSRPVHSPRRAVFRPRQRRDQFDLGAKSIFAVPIERQNPAIASGPSLTTLAHAHPFAVFNLHNRHSRKNQLLSKNLGSTLTATGAPSPARMARSARPVVEGQNVSVEQHWLEGHYDAHPGSSRRSGTTAVR